MCEGEARLAIMDGPEEVKITREQARMIENNKAEAIERQAKKSRIEGNRVEVVRRKAVKEAVANVENAKRIRDNKAEALRRKAAKEVCKNNNYP